MVKGRIVLSLLTAVLAAGPGYGQNALVAERASLSLNRLMAERGELGLDQQHSFKLRASHADHLGQTHARFQQTFQGVPVWGGETITHVDGNGHALADTVDVHRNIHIAVEPSLTPSEALGVAHADLAPKGPYAYAPVAELVIYPITVDVPLAGRSLAKLNAMDMTRQVTRFALAYHVTTLLENGPDETIHRDYMIDAHSGAILKQWNTLHTAAAVGTGQSQYSGTVSLNTNSTSTGFELRDMTRGTSGTFGNNVITNLNHATSGNGTIYTNTTNTWGDGANYIKNGSTTSANGQTAAVDAAWGVQWTWDYYKNVLGRNGIDGNGKATYMRVHYSSNYDNAFWSDSCFCMTFGDGSSFKSLEAMDVMGHEMSHGVCAATANLTYSGESGGLNEANSDIHGTMVEFYSRGGSGSVIGSTGGNWTIGEDLETSSFPTPLRYMYKPSKDGSSPDAWSSTIGNLDVHYSSGPMNRCFYFLSQGSSATTGDYYTSYLPAGMTGVGNDHAARIWYRALATYMTASSNYAAARTASINAAKDLYGAGSADEQAVWNAFHGINVGAAWSGGTTTNTVTATITTPSANVTVASGTAQAFAGTATDSSSSATLTYAWTFGDGGTATGATASHTYTNTGTTNAVYTVTFKATDNTGATASTTRTVTVTPGAVVPGTELIQNGTFENGATSWTGTTAVIGTFAAQPAYAGTKDAFFGGKGKTTTQGLYQTVTIPASATSATLSFYLHIATAETGTKAYDYFYPQVLSNTGTLLKSLATYTNVNAASGWSLKTMDLTAYKGQTVRINFKATEDSSLQSSFVIDNVSLIVK